MPELNFRVKWPDGRIEDCYSPSYIVEEYLSEGTNYAVDDFVERVRTALNIASERVLARYGFACSSALDQLRSIEEAAQALSPDLRASSVRVLSFIKHEPRDARAKAAPERLAVVVVGGGQAGLSVSYLLKERGVSHAVLEAKRIAHTWRCERWDTFCLVTPNWQCRLPGHPYAGADPFGFMLKDEIVDYVESYARRYELPVREGVQVMSVRPLPNGVGYEVRTSHGTIHAEQVVVATGGYHEPRFPKFAAHLPQDILQVHSAAYRNPESLPEGEVLVVGTGQSGAQIAEDLQLAGRSVHLCVGSAPRCARRYRGKDVVEWLEQMGHYDVPISQQQNPEDLRERANHYVSGRGGGRDLDLRAFARAGMRLYGPLLDVEGSTLRFAPELGRHLDAADDVYRSINRAIDAHIEKLAISTEAPSVYAPLWQPEREVETLELTGSGITSAVFCTGFHTNFRWIEADVFDDHGRPRHDRGVTQAQGLYFIGLPWLNTWGSGRFSAVGRDAEYLVARICKSAPLRENLEAAPAKVTASAL